MSDRGYDREKPPQGWWNNQVERRINDMHVSLERISQELREEGKKGDQRQWAINNLDDRVKDVRLQLEKLQEAIREEVVTKEDFKPYRNGIILMLSTIVLTVLGAIMKLVIVAR